MVKEGLIREVDGRVGMEEERIWGRITKIKTFQRRHMNTYCYRSFLKYVHAYGVEMTLTYYCTITSLPANTE